MTTCEPRWRYQALLALATAAGVLGTAWGEYSCGTTPVHLALDITLGLAGAALVPLSFRYPVAFGLVTAVLAGLAPTATPPASIGVQMTAHRRPFPLAAAVAAVSVAAHLLRGLWRPTVGLSYGWWVVLVVVVHVALVCWGALASARRALIASLEERALRAETEQGRRVAEARAAERNRIAREMHDVLAHRLSLLATYAGALEFRPDAAPEKLAEAAGVVRAGAHQALGELRDVIGVLREDGGTDRPVPQLSDLPELVDESCAVGTPVEVSYPQAEPPELPGVAGRTAYRVVQEALTNARKHAPGQPVKIALAGSPGARLEIDVTNPLGGSGADLPGAGRGLVGLTERVRLAGGRLDHHAVAGQFRLHAWLPWPS